jgi:UMF1 family MFS transporter
MRSLAWALFDFANTFFAVAMLSFFFPLWITEDLGAKEFWFSLALALSMAGVALAMPVCGALSDVVKGRIRFLRWSTYGCISAILLTGVTYSLVPALILFGIANFCYQLGTIFYDALLWQVAAPDRVGWTSGYGAAFGYLGSMAGLLLLWPFVQVGGHHAAFVPSGLFFLLFALPCFLLIREPSDRGPALASGQITRSALLRLSMTIRSARSLGGLWRLLWASFFGLNAINTVLAFMAIYTRRVMGLSEIEMIRFFIFSQTFAILGSLTFGRTVQWWGAKRSLGTIWVGWIVALGLLAAVPASRVLWCIGPLVGLCLGPTWAALRVLIVELSPKDQLAEMFGLAGLFGRASAIIGPLLWGVIVWDPARYRHAVVALIALLMVGLWLLRGVHVPRSALTRTG